MATLSLEIQQSGQWGLPGVLGARISAWLPAVYTVVWDSRYPDFGSLGCREKVAGPDLHLWDAQMN